MFNLRLCSIFFLILLSPFFATAGELLLSGVYRGSNLYIQNPHDGEGNYCITAIYINNQKLPEVPQATAFDLDLSSLEVNSPVIIKIFHNDNCRPKILNPNAIRTKDDFQFSTIDVNQGGVTWSAKGEKKFGKYFVMKYQHNTWEMIKAVDSQGTQGENNYTEKVLHHSGKNKYKIKYLDVTGRIFYSEEKEFISAKEEVDFFPKRVSKSLTFTSEVSYEILDAYGVSVKKGTGIDVDCSDLKTGAYYVVFDNKTERFFKK